MIIIQYDYEINGGDYELEGMVAVGDDREAQRVLDVIEKAADVFGFSGRASQRTVNNIRVIPTDGSSLDDMWDELK